MIKCDIDNFFNLDEGVEKIYRLYYKYNTSFIVLMKLIELNDNPEYSDVEISVPVIGRQIEIDKGEYFNLSRVYGSMSRLYKIFGVKNQTDLIKVTTEILNRIPIKPHTSDFDKDIDKMYAFYYRNRKSFSLLIKLIDLHGGLDDPSKEVRYNILAYEMDKAMPFVSYHKNALYRTFGVYNQIGLIKVTSEILDKMVAKSGACHE